MSISLTNTDIQLCAAGRAHRSSRQGVVQVDRQVEGSVLGSSSSGCTCRTAAEFPAPWSHTARRHRRPRTARRSVQAWTTSACHHSTLPHTSTTSTHALNTALRPAFHNTFTLAHCRNLPSNCLHVTVIKPCMLIIQITKIVHHICYDCKCVSVFINQLHILWRVVVSQRVGLAMKRLRV